MTMVMGETLVLQDLSQLSSVLFVNLRIESYQYAVARQKSNDE
jgi:hypothetical protein